MIYGTKASHENDRWRQETKQAQQIVVARHEENSRWYTRAIGGAYGDLSSSGAMLPEGVY